MLILSVFSSHIHALSDDPDLVYPEGRAVRWLPELDSHELSHVTPGSFPKLRRGVIIDESGDVIAHFQIPVLVPAIDETSYHLVVHEQSDRGARVHFIGNGVHRVFHDLHSVQAIGQGKHKFQYTHGVSLVPSLGSLGQLPPSRWMYLDTCLSFIETPAVSLGSPYEFVRHTEVDGVDLLYNRVDGLYYFCDADGNRSPQGFVYHISQKQLERDHGLIAVAAELNPFKSAFYDTSKNEFIQLGMNGGVVGSSPDRLVVSDSGSNDVYDHEMNKIGSLPEGERLHTVLNSGYIVIRHPNRELPMPFPQVLDRDLEPIDFSQYARVDKIDQQKYVYARRETEGSPLCVLDANLDLIFEVPPSMRVVGTLGDSGFLFLDSDLPTTTYVLYDVFGKEVRRYSIRTLLDEKSEF